MKSPARLELLIEKKSKRDGFALATRRKVSMGRLFELLIAAEMKRDGEVNLPPGTPEVQVPV